MIYIPKLNYYRQIILEQFGKHIRSLKILPVYGGTDIYQQIKALRRGVQIVVATPGRLRDLIKRKAINIEEIEYVVLDEADEMLNMGFKEEIDEILENDAYSDNQKDYLNGLYKWYSDNNKNLIKSYN